MQTSKKNFKIKGMVFKAESYLSPKNSMTNLSPQPRDGSLRFSDNLRRPYVPILSPRPHQINKNFTIRSARFHSEFKKPTTEIIIPNVEIKFTAFRQFQFSLPDNTSQPRVQCSYQTREHENQQLHIICEGHGKHGKECSKVVGQQLVEKLQLVMPMPDQQNTVNTYFSDVYNTVNREIQFQKDFDVTQNGSTAISLLIAGSNLYCSNVGDSKALFFYKDVQNKLLFKQLNHQHSLERISEQQRILSHGGKIEQESVDYVRQGPLKIWLKHNKTQGILLPRCIGYSQWKSIGVTCEPETSHHSLTTLGYVIMGNSQLFELVDTIDIGKIVEKHFPPQSAQSINQVSDQILQLAKSRNQNSLNIQQIIIVVVFMGN